MATAKSQSVPTVTRSKKRRLLEPTEASLNRSMTCDSDSSNLSKQLKEYLFHHEDYKNQDSDMTPPRFVHNDESGKISKTNFFQEDSPLRKTYKSKNTENQNLPPWSSTSKSDNSEELNENDSDQQLYNSPAKHIKAQSSKKAGENIRTSSQSLMGKTLQQEMMSDDQSENCTRTSEEEPSPNKYINKRHSIKVKNDLNNHLKKGKFHCQKGIYNQDTDYSEEELTKQSCQTRSSKTFNSKKIIDKDIMTQTKISIQNKRNGTNISHSSGSTRHFKESSFDCDRTDSYESSRVSTRLKEKGQTRDSNSEDSTSCIENYLKLKIKAQKEKIQNKSDKVSENKRTTDSQKTKVSRESFLRKNHRLSEIDNHLGSFWDKQTTPPRRFSLRLLEKNSGQKSFTSTTPQLNKSSKQNTPYVRSKLKKIDIEYDDSSNSSIDFSESLSVISKPSNLSKRQSKSKTRN